MSDHVREIGPHRHEWTVVHQTEACVLLECALCGSRRVTGHDPALQGRPQLAAWHEAWVDGGPLPQGIGK